MAAPGAAPQETEIKLLFPPELRAQIEAHPALHPPGAAPPEQQDEDTVYFDTADHKLAARGLSLRASVHNRSTSDAAVRMRPVPSQCGHGLVEASSTPVRSR